MSNEINGKLWPGWEAGGAALSTERLLLTAPTAEDAPALTRIQNTDFVLRCNAMEVWDEDRMRGWIEKNAPRQIVLRRREDHTPIGLVGLAEDSLRYGVDSVELNCYLAEDYARQGYMKEALSCILRRLFEAGAERDACQAILDYYGGYVYPWGIDMTTDEGQACFAYYAWGNGGGFVDADGNWALNTPENVEAVEFAVGLVNKGFTNPNPATETRYDLQDMFAAGRLAMLIAPSQLPTYVADKGGEINMITAAIPANEGKTGSSVGVMDRVMAFRDDEAPNQARRNEAIGKFMTFFYAPENYVGWISMENFLPAVTSAVEAQIEADPSFGAWLDVLGSCQFYPAAKAEWAVVRQGVTLVEQNALIGGSVKEALDALQREVT